MPALQLSENASFYTSIEGIKKLVGFINEVAQITLPSFRVSNDNIAWKADENNVAGYAYDSGYPDNYYYLDIQNNDLAIAFKRTEKAEEHREGATYRFHSLDFEVKGLPKGAKLNGALRAGATSMWIEVITYSTKHEAVKKLFERVL